MTAILTANLGHGVRIEYQIGLSGSVIGIIETHNFPGSKQVCSNNVIMFDLPEVHQRYPGLPVWKVTSPVGAPLSLWPAIYCNACRRHGFIFEGQWSPDG